MGNQTSKKSSHETSSAKTATITSMHYTTELRSYEAACKADTELQSFDTCLQARTSHVISTLATGVEVRALSFDSLKEVTECLLEMNQEVVKVILDCKKDIWKNQELFELVEDYFENSLKTLDFCAALEKGLRKARDSQLLILVALQQFEDESLLEGKTIFFFYLFLSLFFFSVVLIRDEQKSLIISYLRHFQLKFVIFKYCLKMKFTIFC